ncbi:MAG TPA: energy transducer TonB [Drouetiella sp.]
MSQFFQNKKYLFALVALLGMAATPQAFADGDDPTPVRAPLKGGIEDTNVIPSKKEKFQNEIPMATPVPSKKLQGEADQSGNPLKGNAEDEGDANLQGMNGQSDKNMLQGNANQLQGSAEDEEAGDKELSVEWDAWRNRFLRAVQTDVQSNLNNSDDTMARFDPRSGTVIRQFPVGTTAWFKCDIREDKKIVNFELVKSSGYPNFDRLVMDAVAALNGTDILQFPARSKRHKVNQMAGIQTSTQSNNTYFHFGDTEKYREPSR